MPGAVEFISKRESLLLTHPVDPLSESLGFFVHLSPENDQKILSRFGREHILVQITANESNDLIILSCGSYHPGLKLESVSSNDYNEDTQSFEFYHLLPVPLSFYPYIWELFKRNNHYLQNTADLREIVEAPIKKTQ